MPLVAPRAPSWIALSLVGSVACGGSGTADEGADESSGGGDVTLEWAEAPPVMATSSESSGLMVRAVDSSGMPVTGIALELTVERGGGVLTSANLTTADDAVDLGWTLGPAPVLQRVRVIAPELDDAELVADLDSMRASPLRTDDFQGIESWLTDQGEVATTEDLAFAPGGHITLGVGPRLVDVDTNLASFLPLSGDPIGAAIGVAYDRDGVLFVADGGNNALLAVDPGGTVRTVATTDGTQPLEGPNYVAIAPDGDVLVSDPCLGEIIRFDPVTGDVRAVLTMDLPTQGGPNGIAMTPEADAIVFLTENTAIVCGHFSFVDPVGPIAGLYRAPLTDAGFGEVELIQDDLGLFGDGLAYDVEGNLYAVIDTESGGTIDASVIDVLPEGGTTLRPFMRAQGALYANVAFGQGAFGDTQLYIALLRIGSIPIGMRRGLEVGPVGIRGLPLLP